MAEKLFHCAELDPALDLTAGRVALTLKVSLLFCPQLIIPDTHLLHNHHWQALMQTPEIKELLSSRDHTGRPHVIASVRQRDLHGIISSQLDGRIFLEHVLNRNQLARAAALRRKRKLDLNAFYGIASAYHQHVDECERLFIDSNQYRTYQNSPGQYAARVKSALQSVLALSGAPRIRRAASELLDAIQRRTAKTHVNRSDLWRLVDKYELNAVERDLIRKWVLILPYNRHIAESDGFEMCYSNTLTPHLIRGALEKLPQFTKNAWELDSSIFYDSTALQEFGRLNFAQIARIRERAEFTQTLSAFELAVQFDDGKEASRAMREHIKFLDKSIGEELGVRSKPDNPVVLDFFFKGLDSLAQTKFPIVKLFPPSRAIFSRVTDRVMLLVRNPRRQILQMVGESIAASALKKEPRLS
jgi:hypothetical protein